MTSKTKDISICPLTSLTSHNFFNFQNNPPNNNNNNMRYNDKQNQRHKHLSFNFINFP